MWIDSTYQFWIDSVTSTFCSSLHNVESIFPISIFLPDFFNFILHTLYLIVYTLHSILYTLYTYLQKIINTGFVVTFSTGFDQWSNVQSFKLSRSALYSDGDGWVHQIIQNIVLQKIIQLYDQTGSAMP